MFIVTTPSFDKPHNKQMDCVAAWHTQKGRPVASPKNKHRSVWMKRSCARHKNPSSFLKLVSYLLKSRSGTGFIG